MKLRMNPFDRANPISWKDAATLATITAFVTWILTFLVNATIGQIRADVVEFFFEAVKAYTVAWAANFITLAGLEQVYEKVEKRAA